MAINLVIVEKHAMTAWCIEELLSSSRVIQVVRVCDSIQSLMSQPSLLVVDVIFLDINVFDSLDVCEAFFGFIKNKSAAKVLVLMPMDSLLRPVEVISFGVSGVVYPSTDAEMVLRAIQKVRAGQIWVDRKYIHSIINILAKEEVDVPGKNIAQLNQGFTNREVDVIRLITRRVDLKQYAIADELGMSENTLRNHLTNIYKKLGVRGRIELYAYVKLNGLSEISAK